MSTSAIALSLPNYYRRYDLPWTGVAEERQRLRKIFLSVAGASLLLSIAMPLLPSTPVSHSSEAEVPPRYAKMLIERKTPPPPPKPAPPPEPVAEAPPEPAKAPEPKPEPKVEPPKPKPQPRLAYVPKPEVTPERPVNEARERAAQAGIMAMADELAELREAPNLDAALSNRTLSDSVGAAERSERALVTSASGRASGGINTAALSRNTGGQGRAGRTVTKVESPVARAAATPRAAAGGGGQADGSGPGQRSRDQIEQIFDRNKAAIYALYRRALRQDPTLQGKLVLELTIAPSGQVTDVRIVSSELGAPEFEEKLLKRVRLFKFGEQNVGTITTTKPIDFFPV